jgi:hypothetical protein
MNSNNKRSTRNKKKAAQTKQKKQNKQKANKGRREVTQQSDKHLSNSNHRWVLQTTREGANSGKKKKK